MSKKSPFLNDIYNFCVGFCMGGANVIPGVSGGTMLFILGAFNQLTDAIRSIASVETLKLFFSADWKALNARIQWRFLIGIGIGLLVSFATLAKLFVWLLAEHQQLTYAFFFGLIISSIITVNRQIKKWSFGAIICFIISAIGAFAIISLVPVDGGSQWYMLMLYGAICIIAMILPGLSGSFLLLIFGQYERVWKAVSNIARFQFNLQEITDVLLLAAGAIIGIALFVHLLNFLMKYFYNATIASLIGFMLGAIPRLWPWQHEQIISKKLVYEAPVCNGNLPWIILSVLGGIALVLIIDFCAKGGESEKNAKENK
ncbi:MAG: DUF368 domain-containing protein [Lentisphaeria bacterium]|nr:DUF368 domain-containing protein [Lentisphaeria bacterium]